MNAHTLRFVPAALLPLLAGILFVPAAMADYESIVDLTNASGEVKTDWPVVLRVYTVLGRNLDPAALQPDGFHVYGPAGREVPHHVEVIPPVDQPGNDEIVFLVPRIEPGQTLRYRITNTSVRSPLRRPIDLPASPHNLLTNGSFEQAGDGRAPAGFADDDAVQRDTRECRSGEASLMLTADARTVSTRYNQPISLHKGSWYYFGAWSKTDRVSRFGYEAGNAAHFRFTYADAAATRPADRKPFGAVTPQCSTRDWLKVTFESGHTDWGMERYVTQATGDKADLEFVLEQRRHYYMEPGQTRGTWWLDDVVLLEQPEVNVRFDLAVEPLVENGIFLFTRTPVMPLGQLQELDENRRPMERNSTIWASMPFAHERLDAFDRFALKGQRVSLCVGLYHTRPLEDVVVRLAGDGLKGPGGAVLPVETIEYCPGYLGAEPSRYMKIVGEGNSADPVDLKDDRGVRYFFVTFHAPRNASPGKYTGTIDVRVGETLHQAIPVTLRVQDMAQPILRDIYVGLIYNGGLPDVDDMLKQYARSGFSCITWFHRWVPHGVGPDGKEHVDAAGLGRKLQQLLDLGITAGVGLYTDVQVDDRPKPHQGWMIRAAREEAGVPRPDDEWRESDPPAVKEVYARLLGELDAASKADPDWPRLIHMNWDEPPPYSDRMGWTNEILPDAITTLDVQFARLPRIMKYYNTPAMDDPANWAGPEIYHYLKRNGKNFGMCGATDTAEANRYQAGMFMIASGATYFHAWHIRGGHTPGQMAWDDQAKRTIRGHEMISWAGGMDDLKAYRLLKDAIDEARSQGRSPDVVKAAEDYLAGIFAVFNGDHKDRWSLEPYLGTAWSWGYEGFYDDWQEQMARHAAAIRGIEWIE